MLITMYSDLIVEHLCHVGIFLFYILNRSKCRLTAPPSSALTLPRRVRKTTALWFCWLQTPAVRALKRANATTVTVVVTVLPSQLSPQTPSPPCKALASVIARRRATHKAAHPALLLKRNDLSPLTWARLPSAPSVLEAQCLQVVEWRPQRPWS